MDDCNLFGGRVRLKGPRTSTKAYCALECYCTKVLAKIGMTVLSFFYQNTGWHCYIILLSYLLDWILQLLNDEVQVVPAIRNLKNSYTALA